MALLLLLAAVMAACIRCPTGLEQPLLAKHSTSNANQIDGKHLDMLCLTILSLHECVVQADKALQLMLFDIKDRGNARLAGLSMEDRAEVRKAEQAAEQAYQHAFNADNAACGPRNHAERLAKGPGRGLSGAQQLHAARQQVAAAEAEAQRQQDLAEEAARKAKEVFLQQQSQAAAAAEQAAAELLREEEAEAARAAQTAERSQQQAAKRAAKKARQKQRKVLATPPCRSITKLTANAYLPGCHYLTCERAGTVAREARLCATCTLEQKAHAEQGITGSTLHIYLHTHTHTYHACRLLPRLLRLNPL